MKATSVEPQFPGHRRELIGSPAPPLIVPALVVEQGVHSHPPMRPYHAVLDLPRIQQAYEVRPGNTQHVGRLRSEEHTSELQSRENLVCRLLLEKKNNK